MTSTSAGPSLPYIDSLAAQLRDVGEAALRMLEDTFAADASILIPVCGIACIVNGAADTMDADEPAIAIAARIVKSASRREGRAALLAALDELDLGAAIDIETDVEPIEQVSRFEDLIELGCLSETLIRGRHQGAIVEVLERNAATVVFEAEQFRVLNGVATIIAIELDLAADHPVASFLDAVIAATGELELPPMPTLAPSFETVRDVVDARLSTWARLRERWSGFSRAITECFQVGAEPVVAHAATHDLQWPPQRMVLAQREADELGLVVWRGEVLLEWLGAEAPTSVAADRGPMAVAAGPLAAARYWLLSAEAATAQALVVSFAAAPSWTVVLSPPTDVPEIPIPAHLSLWHAVSPGSLRAVLVAHGERLATTHRAWSHDFAREAGRIVVLACEPLVGRAWFPVVFDGVALEGALAQVDSGVLAPSDALAPSVRAWLARLVGVEDASALDALAVHFTRLPGIDVRGQSHELAAAVAALSSLLERAPRQAPILSGCLGDAPGEVLPIARADTKRRVIAAEAPDAYVRVVTEPADARPWLVELFGADWAARLRDALGLDGAAHAREAMRAWQRFSHGYSVMELATRERTRALQFAEAALSAGVEGLARVHALWVCGAMRLHHGETVRAHIDLTAARAALAARPPGELDRFTVQECDAFLAIALVDSGRPADAVALLTPDLERLEQVAHDARDRRWHLVRIQVAGSLQRAHAGLGDLERAFVILRDSLSVSHVAEQRARSLADLAELERRRGDLAAARAWLVDARSHLDDILDEAARARTERFVRLYEARALQVPVDYPIAAPEWSAWPQPIEVLESLLDSPDGALAEWFAAHVAPTLGKLGSVWLLVLLGAAARACTHDTSAADMRRDVARELASRADIDDDTRAAAVSAIDDGAPDRMAAWVRRAPY